MRGRISPGNGRVAGVRRIVALCSLCSHEYARLFDEAETAEHLAEAHGMYFDPRPLRPSRREAIDDHATRA